MHIEHNGPRSPGREWHGGSTVAERYSASDTAGQSGRATVKLAGGENGSVIAHLQSEYAGVVEQTKICQALPAIIQNGKDPNPKDQLWNNQRHEDEAVQGGD
jgi:hypothetical protein